MQNHDPKATRSARLIVFSGLPGVGKSGIARELASEIDAVYLRIDSIEQVLRDSGAVPGEMNDAGYRIAYSVAEDNLRIGRTVVADCVNPISITRNAWLEIADRVGVRALEVEVRCSKAAEHRRRVESRKVDIPGLIPPTWREVLDREYEPWDRDHLVVDTATESTDEMLTTILRMLND